MADSPDAPDAAELEAQISADLVARIRHGDRGAEQTMIERYGHGLLYLIRRRTRDHELALDLRQDTFRVAIEKLRASPPEEPERLAAYLRGIALHLWMAYNRKAARRATSADSEAVALAADDAPGPPELVDRVQAQEAVRVLLQELHVPRDREILTRLYLEEEDKDSICAGLGIDSTHFNRVLFRAKQRLKELVTGLEAQGRLRVVR